jgi:hypothetical protein
MIIDPQFIQISIVLLFIFNIVLLYLPNMEGIGFDLLFILSLLSNSFFFYNVSPVTDFSRFLILSVVSLMVASLFMVVLSLHNIQKKTKTSSVDISLKPEYPERRRAIDNYKIIYIVCQVLVFFLLFCYSENFLSGFRENYYILGFGTFIFLSVWLGTWIREDRKDTDMYPFQCGLGSSLTLVFFIGRFFKGAWGLDLVWTQSAIGLSSFLVFLSNWIYKNSTHLI